MTKASIPANIKSRIAIYKVFCDGLVKAPVANVQQRKALQRGIDIYEKKFAKMGIDVASFA